MLINNSPYEFDIFLLLWHYQYICREIIIIKKLHKLHERLYWSYMVGLMKKWLIHHHWCYWPTITIVCFLEIGSLEAKTIPSPCVFFRISSLKWWETKGKDTSMVKLNMGEENFVWNKFCVFGHVWRPRDDPQ